MPTCTVDGLIVTDVPRLDLGLDRIYRIRIHDARVQSNAFLKCYGYVRLHKTGTAKITNIRRVKLMSMAVKMLRKEMKIRLDDDPTKA